MEHEDAPSLPAELSAVKHGDVPREEVEAEPSCRWQEGFAAPIAHHGGLSGWHAAATRYGRYSRRSYEG